MLRGVKGQQCHSYHPALLLRIFSRNFLIVTSPTHPRDAQPPRAPRGHPRAQHGIVTRAPTVPLCLWSARTTGLLPAHGVAPSAQMYYGWPQELREAGGSDVAALVDAARQAAAGGGGEEGGAHPD